MFNYLGVLISVIMGLGIVHLMVGLSKLIHNRRTVRPYWVHLLWTVNVLIYILVIWFGMFWWNDLPEWSVLLYFLVTFYAIVQFLLASILYPWDLPPGLDFRDYFYENRKWFFGIHGLAWLVDIPETVLKETEGLRDVPFEYPFIVAFLLVLSAVGFATANRKVHAALPILWFVAGITNLLVSSLGSIAVT